MVIFIRLSGGLVGCGSMSVPLFVCVCVHVCVLVNMFVISGELLKCSMHNEMLFLLQCVHLFVAMVHLLVQRPD